LKIFSIRKSQEFKDINKKGKKFYSKTLILTISKPTNNFSDQRTIKLKSDDFCRVGYVVSKKISKLAVKRNKIKRRFREAFRRSLKNNLIKKNCDYIIIARLSAVNTDYLGIIKDLEFCLKESNKL